MNNPASWKRIKLGGVGKQRIDQGTIGMSRSRVNHQARRLVDDEERVILKDDVERQVLRLEIECFLLGIQLQSLSAEHRVPRPAGLAVDPKLARPNPRLQLRTREVGEQNDGNVIQPFASALGRHRRRLAYHLGIGMKV